MLRKTGCRGVMIGRAALSRPWIFRDTWSWLTTGTIPPAPGIEEKCDLMRQHFAEHGKIPLAVVGGDRIPPPRQLVRQGNASLPYAQNGDADD